MTFLLGSLQMTADIPWISGSLSRALIGERTAPQGPSLPRVDTGILTARSGIALGRLVITWPSRRSRSRQPLGLMPSFRGHAASLLWHLMPRGAESIPESITRNPWMSQSLTEEARRGWPDGAPDSPPAGPSVTLAEYPPLPSPVNLTAPGPPEITTADAVAIAPARRCRMLRLFRPLRQLMLLRQDGWMPRPPQHPQLVPRHTSQQLEIQSKANDEVPGLPENEFLP